MEAYQPTYVLKVAIFDQYLREIYKPFQSAMKVTWGPLDDAMPCLLLLTLHLQSLGLKND